MKLMNRLINLWNVVRHPFASYVDRIDELERQCIELREMIQRVDSESDDAMDELDSNLRQYVDEKIDDLNVPDEENIKESVMEELDIPDVDDLKDELQQWVRDEFTEMIEDIYESLIEQIIKKKVDGFEDSIDVVVKARIGILLRTALEAAINSSESIPTPT